MTPSSCLALSCALAGLDALASVARAESLIATQSGCTCAPVSYDPGNASAHAGCAAGWCDVTEDCATGRDKADGYPGWDYCAWRTTGGWWTVNSTSDEEPAAQENTEWVMAAVVVMMAWLWHLKTQDSAVERGAAEAAAAPPPAEAGLQLPTRIPCHATLAEDIAEQYRQSQPSNDTPRPTAEDIAAIEAARMLKIMTPQTNDEIVAAVEQVYASFCPAKVGQAAELVERYQGREKLLLRLVQSKYHPGSGSYDPTLPTPR